jgi:hypothetical protein
MFQTSLDVGRTEGARIATTAFEALNKASGLDEATAPVAAMIQALFNRRWK